MSGTSTPISDEADSNTSMEEDRELLLQSTAMNTIEPEDNGIAAMEPARKTGAGERVRREEVTSYVWFMSSLLFDMFQTRMLIHPWFVWRSIGGVLVGIGSDLGRTLSDGNKELITSATTAGAFVGGIGAGVISDKIGRKMLLSIADVAFILGAVMQATAHSLGKMTAGRAVLGLGVGMASCVCPLLISELAPTHLRGRLVTVNAVAITFGQVLAYTIGAIFEHSQAGWRWMSGFCAIPAIIQLGALFFLPDSPRQLVVRNRISSATAALRKIYSQDTPAQIEDMVADLQKEAHGNALLLGTSPTIVRVRRKSYKLSRKNPYPTTFSFNTLIYYSATLFASMGFSNPIAVGLIISGTNFIGTLFALKYIDSIGRRRILTMTVPGMALGLLLAAMSFYYLTIHTKGRLDPNADYSSTWTGLVLFSMVFYIFAYAIGIGAIPWLQSELFGIAYRGIGTSISTGCNWASNLLIASTYLTLVDAITPSGAFGLYGGTPTISICIVGWIFVILCYPETAGLDIEEVQVIFEKDFGIEASERLRVEKGDRQRLEEQSWDH
ncbi:MAG: myo-inositol transporter [Cyphobasidiales sp. Tagirdzhanova-0007]|nr:MAG: myo-inositol transporter [Cyphobasidiales sp. Tagirdzhanova-0007]